MANRGSLHWCGVWPIVAGLALAGCSAADGAGLDEAESSSEALTAGDDGAGYSGGDSCKDGKCEPCKDHECRCKRDKEPPVVSVAGGGELWPPNHRYVTKTLEDCGIRIYDDCDGHIPLHEANAHITCVTSDEPENGSGDGNTVDDIVISPDGQSVHLRAERSGGGDGRVYTIYFAVSDKKGNEASGRCVVSVPHDQGGGAAVAGPPQYRECR